MRPPPIGAPFDTASKPSRVWVEWIKLDLFGVASLNVGNGSTADRPVNGLNVGSHYFDTTLGIPIWYDGSGWVDAQGNSV